MVYHTRKALFAGSSINGRMVASTYVDDSWLSFVISLLFECGRRSRLCYIILESSNKYEIIFINLQISDNKVYIVHAGVYFVRAEGHCLELCYFRVNVFFHCVLLLAVNED